MANYNKVLLMGNLTRDPELKYLQSGQAVVNIGLAVNRKYRNRNTQEMVEETTFVDIEGWGQQAETFSKYMTKGRPVFIEGRLRLDSWEGKDGQKKNKLRVVMERFQFIGGPGERSAAGDPAEAGQVADGGGEDYDFEDIPF
jgi:single-strand DNA-binding protein